MCDSYVRRSMSLPGKVLQNTGENCPGPGMVRLEPGTCSVGPRLCVSPTGASPVDSKVLFMIEVCSMNIDLIWSLIMILIPMSLFIPIKKIDIHDYIIKYTSEVHKANRCMISKVD